MMQVIRFIIASLFFGVLLFRGEVFAQEKETIRWITGDQVPYHIFDGKFKEQGIVDLFMKTIQNKLPQYNHVNIVTNAGRYLRLIQEKDTCNAWTWIVPGSKAYRLYSRPVGFTHQIGIHILKSKQHLFGEPGEVLSLAKLLANSELKYGHIKGMGYTEKVNELHEQYRDQKYFYVFSPKAVEFDLKLLTRNRLDYFLGFPAQATYDAELKGISNNYQFYNVEEINQYTSMHLHCSKSAFGEKIMEEVKKILTDEILMEHLELVERWNGEDKQYRDVFIDHVINQNDNDLVTHFFSGEESVETE